MEALPHGIGVNNRFELFYDEEVDPLEILRRQEEELLKRKTEKIQGKDKTKPVKVGKSLTISNTQKPESAPAKVVKNTDVEVPNKQRGKPNERPVRGGGNFQESRESDKNVRNKDDHFFNPDRDSENRRGRGGYRGGRGRGDRGGRGFFPNPEGRNRRMFDRHSGSDKTGVRPTDKRYGAGSNNWGDIRSDINQRKEEAGWDTDFEAGVEKQRESGNWADNEQNESKSGEDDTINEPTTENPEVKETEQATEEQIQEMVKEMTLDEYKREQEAKRVVPKYNLRKPGEGEDDKQWKKGYVLKKKPKEEDDDEDEDDEIDDEEYGRKGQQKLLLDFQFNFTDSRRGSRGRGRGGRGGPRGGGRDNPAPKEDRIRENRGTRSSGPSKPRGQQAAPRVDDFNDFPSLVNA